ncbi:flagellar biosynthetic protein FliO [Chengkuizengella sp. SCS-71B]|uniref:flagellar biosynthetic protein FliO n=1 Tax=Chengkuizengella sp. SCS-71B TaxID=3115290 RepID=UPI0032C21F65
MATLKNTTYTLNKLMPPLQNTYEEGLTEQFFLVFFMLLFIIALIFLVFKFLSKKNTWMSNSLIKHLGGVKLGQKNSIQVIEFGGDIYLIGVGDEVQLIEKIDQIEKINLIKQTLNSNQKSINLLSFKSIFNSLNKNNEEEIHKDNHANSTFHEVIYEKMNNVKKRNQKIDSMINDKNKDRENKND